MATDPKNRWHLRGEPPANAAALVSEAAQRRPGIQRFIWAGWDAVRADALDPAASSFPVVATITIKVPKVPIT